MNIDSQLRERRLQSLYQTNGVENPNIQHLESVKWKLQLRLDLNYCIRTTQIW